MVSRNRLEMGVQTMQHEHTLLCAGTSSAPRAGGRTYRSVLVRLMVILCLILLAPSKNSYAAGGYGSVWTTAVTNSSITIDWTDPTGDYRYVSGTPSFEICYKVGGSLEGACNGGTVISTTQKPYQISGLQPGTNYKIKVFGFTEHKNWFGKWRDPDFRKVGTLTQSTTFQVVLPENSVRISGTSAYGMDVEVTVPNPQDYAFIRVCYKNEWYLTLANFCTTCFGYQGPQLGWGGSSENLGWVQSPPAGQKTTFHLVNLKKCRQYKVCAYGFAPGPAADGNLIGEAKAHTGIGCLMIALDSVTSIRDVITDPIEDNYEDVLVQYDSAVTAFYGGTSIFDHVAATHSELIVDRAAFEDEGNDFTTGFDVLRFLIQGRRDIFDQWQSESPLVTARLTLDLWLHDSHPDLYAALLDEASALPPGYSIPTLAEWGLIIFGTLLLGSVVFYIRRRRRVVTA